MADITTTSLQAVGLSTAFLLSGFSFGVSWMVLPATYKLDPSSSLPLFRSMFYAGGAFTVPIALLATTITGTAAYRNAEQKVPLSIATGIVLAPLAFTGLVMMPGIQKLLNYEANSAERTKAGTAQIVQLLQAWNAQNLVRAGLCFTAGVLGLYLLLQRMDSRPTRL